MRYETVLFDLDGTLTDPFEGITRCVQHALAQQGIRVADRRTLTPYIGPPLESAFRTLHGLDAEAAAQAVADYRERFGRLGLYENRVYDGMPGVLARLRAGGYPLFVATSKPWCYARRIVEHFGLGAYFGAVYGSELDGHRTDKSVLIAHVLRDQRLRAERTLMIGDRRFDVLGARHNGVASAAVAYGYGAPDELQSAAPDHVFHAPADIAAFLLAEARA